MTISIFSFTVATVATVTLADNDQCVDISVKNEGGYILEVWFPGLADAEPSDPGFQNPCDEEKPGNTNLAFGQSSRFRVPHNTAMVLKATAGGETGYIVDKNADYVCGGTTLTIECSETPRQ